MNQYRIHIFGGSGSGTSTLGRELAKKLRVPFFDADDYYWQLTDPPFRLKNTPEDRVEKLLSDMNKTRKWLLSGFVVSWGDAFIPLFTLAIFVTLPRDIRLGRLHERERQRYGKRIDDGGDMHEISKAFMEWAALYDTAGTEVRSLVMHEDWIKRLECPVIRVQSLKAVDKLADELIRQIML
jgi:adenylate kinase family enzyme